MENYLLLVQVSRVNQTIKAHLDGFFDHGKKEVLEAKSFLYQTSLYADHLPHEDIVGLLYSDFNIKVKIAAIGEKILSFVSIDILNQTLKKMPEEIYAVEDLLKHLIITNPKAQKELRQSFAKVLSHSDILTLNTYAANNLNTIKASKSLFLHRNTLTYRLEAIKEKTGIDVKTFKGILIFNLLFSL